MITIAQARALSEALRVGRHWAKQASADRDVELIDDAIAALQRSVMSSEVTEDTTQSQPAKGEGA